MPFALTAAEIDTVAGAVQPYEAHALATAFRRKIEEEDANNAEKPRAWHMLAEIFDMHFRPERRREPFGPLWRIDNRRSMIPDDLARDQVEPLRDLIPDIASAGVRARLGDAIWLSLRDVASARIAVAAYIAVARSVENPDQWLPTIEHVERAARLSKTLGHDDESFATVAAYLGELADRYRGEDLLFMTGKALELLFEFHLGDPAACVIYASTGAERALERHNFHLARYYFELMAKWQARTGNQEAKNAALRELARTYEREAEQRGAANEHLAATHFWHRAIEAHRRVAGGGQIADGLRPRLQQAERDAVPELRQVSTELDLGPLVKQARLFVADQPKLDAVRRLASVCQPANVDQMRETVLEQSRQFPLQSFIGGAILDRDGRIVGRRPAMAPGDQAPAEEAVFARMVEQMNLQRGVRVQGQIIPAFNQVAFEHAISWRDLADIVTHAPFVPPGREMIFAEGLHAGFNQDFIKAVHLLVPQIENSIRHMMNGRAMITTSLDQNGIQREIDLNAILVDPRTAQILPNGVIFELRCLFTDNRGPNLRNKLAHGMLDDGAFLSADAIYAWWLVLLLCLAIRIVPPSEVPEAQG
jgi:hypothetical protein